MNYDRIYDYSIIAKSAELELRKWDIKRRDCQRTILQLQYTYNG